MSDAVGLALWASAECDKASIVSENAVLRERIASMEREAQKLCLELGELAAAADEVTALWRKPGVAVPGGWLPALERLARARE